MSFPVSNYSIVFPAGESKKYQQLTEGQTGNPSDFILFFTQCGYAAAALTSVEGFGRKMTRAGKTVVAAVGI